MDAADSRDDARNSGDSTPDFGEGLFRIKERDGERGWTAGRTFVTAHTDRIAARVGLIPFNRVETSATAAA